MFQVLVEGGTDSRPETTLPLCGTLLANCPWAQHRRLFSDDCPATIAACCVAAECCTSADD